MSKGISREVDMQVPTVAHQVFVCCLPVHTASQCSRRKTTTSSLAKCCANRRRKNEKERKKAFELPRHSKMEMRKDHLLASLPGWVSMPLTMAVEMMFFQLAVVLSKCSTPLHQAQ